MTAWHWTRTRFRTYGWTLGIITGLALSLEWLAWGFPQGWQWLTVLPAVIAGWLAYDLFKACVARKQP